MSIVANLESKSWSRAMAVLIAGATVVIGLRPANAAAQATGTVAFVGANVIPMDGEQVLRNQTVVVRDGRIAAVGPVASTQVPAGATRVEATGKYLVPGIAEMHAHIPSVGAQGPQYAEDVLFLYIAAGATTIRGMQGDPSQFELRRRVESGEIIGPRMWLAAPQLSGNSAPDAAIATRLVREAKEAGYDLLKIQERLSREAYDAIVRTAREVDLPWAGHVPADVGVQHALAERQATIDHIDDYIVAAQRDGVSEPSALTIDESKIPQLARATREAGVAIVPTQSLWETILGAHPVETLRTRPELRYMPPQQIEGWSERVANAYANADREEVQAHVAFRNRMLEAFSDAGVTILMGTDAPQLFSVPGFSLFREMPVMAEAGMTPHQILHSGTLAVARHLNVESEAGTIATGKRADLILLDANPLQDIKNMEQRAGVMVNGRWLSRAEIDRRLNEMAARRMLRPGGASAHESMPQ